MKEICNRKDIEILITNFYDEVKKDALLNPFFKHVNFDVHLPRMIHFWTFVLLDEPGYTTDVTAIHINMPLKQKHFDRWLEIFNKTVDLMYSGEKAEKAKQRVYLVAWTIQSKISN